MAIGTATARNIAQVLNDYQQARTIFVQTIADLASRRQNVECLELSDTLGVILDLVHPLLSDGVPSIQQTAAIALGRLANHEERIAQAIVRRDIMTQLLNNIMNDTKQNKYYKKSALFVVRSVARHSPELAMVVIQAGGLEAILLCLEDFHSGVKEAAAWAISYIARQNRACAQATVDAGCVPLLVLCLQESELTLKQTSASALSDISKHTQQLAQTVVDAGAVAFLTKAITNPDVKLKRQVLSALGSIAKHSLELAEVVVEADIFPEVFIHMAHTDEHVRRTAATLTREICKHSIELAQLVVNSGGIGALVQLIDQSKISTTLLPAIMGLGYIAGHSDQLAIAVIGSKALLQLVKIVKNQHDDVNSDDDDNQHLLAVIAWTLGQIGKHSGEHAKAVAAANLLPALLEIKEKISEDLRSKSKGALKQILQKCMDIEYLEPLLLDAKTPPHILKYLLGQLTKILPNDPRSRRLFVTSGALKKIQELQPEPDSTLAEYIKTINCCFPEEIVRYYSPGYPDSLLERVEEYEPKCPADIRQLSELSGDEDSSTSSV